MRLYKYCNENGLLVLENQAIKFLDVTKTNDPFDCSPQIIESPATRLAMRIKLNRERKSSLFPNLADQEAERRGFSQEWIKSARKKAHHEATRGDKFQEFFRIKANTFFMFCLTSNKMNPLMWSHYSNEHRGLLIEFETDGFFPIGTGAKLLNLELNEVNYDTTRPKLSPTTANTPAVYLTKDRFWKYEGEWRAFALPENLNHDKARDVYTYPIPATAIQSVVLGCRAEPSLKDRLKKILSSPQYVHVELRQAVPKKQTFELEYRELKP